MMHDLFGHRALVDNGERSDFDWYPTPGPFTRSLLYHVPEITGSDVLECASGANDLADVLREEFQCAVTTIDINPQHPAMLCRDTTRLETWRELVAAAGGFRHEWVITNPPFNSAFAMLQHAVAHAQTGVAFLLRKTFLEPTEERGEWLSNNPPSRIIGLPRHNFRGDGTDSVAADWMIWERTPMRNVFPIEIDHLAKERTKGSV